MVANNTQDKRIYVQPEDKPKLEKIVEVKGWKYTTALSRMIQHYYNTDPEMRRIGQHLDVSA